MIENNFIFSLDSGEKKMRASTAMFASAIILFSVTDSSSQDTKPASPVNSDQTVQHDNKLSETKSESPSKRERKPREFSRNMKMKKKMR